MLLVKSSGGGWNLEGRKRFQTFHDKLSKAKRKPNVKAVEEFILDQIQTDYKIGSKVVAKKTGRKRKDFEGKEDELLCFLDSDEETAGKEGEESDSDLEDARDTYQEPRKKRKISEEDEDEESEPTE